MQMKVVIENEAGSRTRHIFSERTRKLQATCDIKREYPFPQGFILGTNSSDNVECLDCYLLTRTRLRSGAIINADPIGLFEQIEDGHNIPKILAVLSGEQFEITPDVQSKLRNFVSGAFDGVKVGRFLGKDKAMALIADANV
jgi:inorganic pyrophosphatase